MRWFLFVTCLVAAIGLVACTSQKTIVTKEGTTTVETNRLHQTVKVSSKEGTAIIGRNAVDAKELGLPMYPGAIASETGGLTTHTKEGSSQVISLNTKDSFDQVYQWYKQRLPAGSEQTHMSLQGGSVAAFVVGKSSDSDQKTVMISQTKDNTTIVLSHHTKTP